MKIWRFPNSVFMGIQNKTVRFKREKMKHMKKQNIIFDLILTGWILLIATSCSKWDDYKDFTKDGEIVYTGKLDSVTVYPGKLRVRIRGILPADPNIVKCIISWNSKGDSVTFPIDKGGEKMVFDQTFQVEEGVQNFKIQTFDAEGNSSIPVYVTGTIYGSRYESGLNNRPIVKRRLFAGDGTLTLDFGEMNLSTGVFATEIKYRDDNNQLDSVRIPIDSSEVEIKNYKVGSNFQYHTLFLPDSNAIDTFFSPLETVEPEITYLRNLGNPFEHAEWDGSRWGVLAGWITNQSAKNAGGDLYGGYELRGGTGVLSFEAGWGIRAVPNGKIYQVTTLPAGTYTFTPTISERGALGVIYAVVVEGSELPDFSNVTTQSMEHVLETGTGQSLEFTLTETKTVAIGFVANMPDDGSYFKVTQIRFTKSE